MTGSKLRLTLILMPLLAAGCASQPSGRMPAIPQSANPSALVAIEIAFARNAQEIGENTAFRKFAAKNAVVFRPQPVLFLEYAKGQQDVPNTTRWQPHKVYSSCDGKTGAVTGAWQIDGKHGYFTTIWNWHDSSKADSKLQPNAMTDGEWKWILRHGDALAKPRPVPDMIETKVASCKGEANAPLTAPPEGAKMKMGLSRDQTLNYVWVVNPDNSRTVTVNLWNGSDFDEVLRDTVAAPAKP